MNSNTTHTSQYSTDQIKELIILARLYLYNHNLYHSAKYILIELDFQNIKPLPSLNFINRTLKKNGLTHRRTGIYRLKSTQQNP